MKFKVRVIGDDAFFLGGGDFQHFKVYFKIMLNGS